MKTSGKKSNREGIYRAGKFLEITLTAVFELTIVWNKCAFFFIKLNLNLFANFQPSSTVLTFTTTLEQPLLRKQILDTIIWPPNDTSIWSVGICCGLFSYRSVRNYFDKRSWSLSSIFKGSFGLVLINLCSILNSLFSIGLNPKLEHVPFKKSLHQNPFYLSQFETKKFDWKLFTMLKVYLFLNGHTSVLSAVKAKKTIISKEQYKHVKKWNW